ncbi:hypothetical protein IW492_00410 [Enterococcus sp. BWB1-3]|uniref:hypothetical protein n=1 Tax=unclassified Enterococcus TaxID=2608891 RepID=UPI0019213DC4|nr:MULTISPECIES: hypothetical protein [unclassified Enterococcus]MBL1227691.1 hypothetical protein [Enterococcus sp. BWB1-3]MCB5952122.1 hypothetical protein [Enterococcus sp. BWT-B8]MCB5954471.1 hypothetical protein [Enterococcus sp. CWB-B31]
MPEDFWIALQNEKVIDNIRKRPGMYIGALGLSGLESMMIQLLDYLLGMAGAPEVSQLAIELSGEQILLSFSSKRKWLFGQKNEQSSSPYLFLQIMLALSEQVGISMQTPKKREIRIYQQAAVVKEASLSSKGEEYRLELAFTPNPAYFGTQQFSYFILFNRCQQLAMLHSGLMITLTDGKDQKNILHYQQGLVEYIFQKDNSLTRGRKPLIIRTSREDVLIQAVISKNPSASIRDSFVNSHLPADGGTHLDGFIQGAVDGMNQFLGETSRMKIMTVENFPERFDFVLSIKIKQRPRYAGTVRQKIRNPELYKIVREAISEEVSIFLRRHPSWYVR